MSLLGFHSVFVDVRVRVGSGYSLVPLDKTIDSGGNNFSQHSTETGFFVVVF